MKLKKIAIYGASFFVVLVIFLNFFFGVVKISASSVGVAKIDNGPEFAIPAFRILKTEGHNINIKADGYIDLEQDFEVRPGIRTLNFNLKTTRDVFIESLPIYDGLWDISYAKRSNQISVIIKQDPYETIKEQALNYLSSQGIDIKNEKIIWGSVAGIRDSVGP